MIYREKIDLENTNKVVVEFERRLSTEVGRQENLDIVKKRDFRREKLPEKYTVKMLYK